MKNVSTKEGGERERVKARQAGRGGYDVRDAGIKREGRR